MQRQQAFEFSVGLLHSPFIARRFEFIAIATQFHTYLNLIFIFVSSRFHLNESIRIIFNEKCS